MPKGPKQWGIGIELAEHQPGPLHFVSALLGGDGLDVCVGLHVMPKPETLHPFINQAMARAIREHVIADVTSVMHEGLPAARTRVELIEDNDVLRGLSEGVERFGIDTLVVARRTRRDEHPIVRLGEVARRLLRRLPAPVVVVPADLGVDGRGLGEGPVIVAVDLSEHSAPALIFATNIARRLGRPLLLAHGIQAFKSGSSHIPAEAMARAQQRVIETATAELHEWVAPMGIDRYGQLGVKLNVFTGDPAKNLLRLAHDLNAALVVTGSRLLGPVERLFFSSVSYEVAAGASGCVAVVPGA